MIKNPCLKCKIHLSGVDKKDCQSCENCIDKAEYLRMSESRDPIAIPVISNNPVQIKPVKRIPKPLYTSKFKKKTGKMDWVKELGYSSESEMIHDLYPRLSLNAVASTLHTTSYFVKDMLEKHGIPVERSGGRSKSRDTYRKAG